jgi:hypothetical protein
MQKRPEFNTSSVPIVAKVAACETAIRLFARADNASQTGVINAIIAVPKRLAALDTAAEDFNLLCRASRSIRREEKIIHFWVKILIVTVLQNRFENILANITHRAPHYEIETLYQSCGIAPLIR